ncbi:MAG: histidine kinase [Microthrixaceae bacterium]
MEGRDQRTIAPRWWALATLVVVAFGVGIVVWYITSVGPSIDAEGTRWPALLVTIVSYGIVGAVLIDRRPDLPFGWLLAGAAATQVIVAGALLPALTVLRDGGDSTIARLGLAASGLGFIPVAVQGIVYVRFPTGSPSSRRGRTLEILIVVGTAIVVVGGCLRSELSDLLPAPSADASNPITAETTIGRIADATLLVAPLVVLAGLVAGIGVLLRYRRARGIERQQLKWMAAGVLVSFALFPFAVAETSWLDLVDIFGSLLFVTTLAIPVLRYRLWAIDTIVRRSAAYAIATCVLIVVYLVVVRFGTGLMSDALGASLAAAVVAVAFAPIRSLAQRVVDRLAYGDRRDPYRTISALDQRLSEVVEPGQVLPALVGTLSSSLRLPYVAIERTSDGVIAAAGTEQASVERWPLVHEGTVEGYLVAAPRSGEDRLDARDRRLLSDIARHAGVAVRAEVLAADLATSRQRLVTAREEERRRIRRDLHDGLGPALTAVGLNIDAARVQLDDPSGIAGGHLDDAREAATRALADVRRLVYGLRPPVLDNHDLAEAIRLTLSRLESARCRVVLDATDLPDLPAAVEVAAYRIVVEAATNSVRHGTASKCHATISHDGHMMLLDVCDDGSSTEPWTPGVGITSMREHASELGGDLQCGPTPNGAHLHARLPLGISPT